MSQANSQSRAPRSKSVMITIFHHFAYLSRFFASIAAILVATESRPVVTRGRSGWRKRTTAFYRQVGSGMTIPAGSVSRAVRMLKAKGYQVEVDDRRPEWRPPAVACSDCSGTNYCCIEHAVGAEHSGLFYCNSERQMREHLVQLIKSLEGQRIAVLTPTQKKRDELLAALATICDCELLLPRDHEYTRPVLVGTFESARRHHPDNFSAVILSNCELGISKRFAEVWEPMESRFFGLLPDGTKLTPLERLMLEAAFGDQLVGLPLACPTVTFCRTPSNPAIEAEDIVSWKRRNIWENAARNAYIADLARAAANSPSQVSPFIAARDAAQINERVGGKSRVCVLVEGLDHARQLTSLLSGWPVIDRVRASAESIDLWATLNLSLAQQSAGCIATYSAVDSANFSFGNVMIRADAGIGRLARDGKATPRVIIDLVDQASAGFAARLHVRLDAYRGEGWEIDEQALAQARGRVGAGHDVRRRKAQ